MEKKGIRLHASMSVGPATTPRSGSARQMRARAGHADAFFYLKGVQLSATHGAAAAAVGCGARALGLKFGSGPGPRAPRRVAPIRLVSYRQGNEPSSSTRMRHATQCFSSSANTLDNGVCCSPPGPTLNARYGPPRSVTMARGISSECCPALEFSGS